MESNHLWAFARVEVAANGVSNLFVQTFHIIGLREDGLADRTGSVATLWGFFNNENKFAHSTPPTLDTNMIIFPSAIGDSF